MCARNFEIGPLHDWVTWYKISHAGTQVAQWDFQNKATCTSPARLTFVLEVQLCNLRPSMADFVPDDWVMGAMTPVISSRDINL